MKHKSIGTTITRKSRDNVPKYDLKFLLQESASSFFFFREAPIINKKKNNTLKVTHVLPQNKKIREKVNQ